MKAQFWIKSSRGTDQKEIVELPYWCVTADDIKSELEQWCSQFGAWHVSDNAVEYGYKLI